MFPSVAIFSGSRSILRLVTSRRGAVQRWCYLPAAYNRRANLALVCPITSQAKGYPFEVALPASLPLSGVVLADHLKSADWAARRAEFVARAPSEVLSEITAKIRPLLGI
jgi:mRNA interferase MazF